MDFSRVQLSDDDRKFQDDVRAFLSEIVTEDVIRRDRETGDNFDEGVHLALGAAGYLEREWKPDSDRAFTRVQRRIWELEKRRAHVPWVTSGTTAMIARSVKKFASPELRAEVLPRVYSGHVRMCLGYTEPEGGSDVATCKTRAVRDGDGWIINGSKMFTTGAHNCQYVFLITNTDPDAPKHKSLTMFLVPLDSPGVEIQGIRTVDGDRTNIVYYSDVRVDDRYRLGAVNDGWTVGAAQRRARRCRRGRRRVGGCVDHDAPGDVHGRRGGQGRATVRGRRRRGGLPIGSQRRPDGGGAVRAEHLWPGRPRTDDARHLSRSDGPAGRRLGASRRCGRSRR